MKKSKLFRCGLRTAAVSIPLGLATLGGWVWISRASLHAGQPPAKSDQQKSDINPQQSQDADSQRQRIATATKMVQLLWEVQPQAAGKSLQALTESLRGLPQDKLATMDEVLEGIDQKVRQVIESPGDSRFAASVEWLVLVEDRETIVALKRLLLQQANVPAESRVAIAAAIGKLAPQELLEPLVVALEIQLYQAIGDVNSNVSLAEDPWRSQLMAIALDSGDVNLAHAIIAAIPKLPSDSVGMVVQKLTERPALARALLIAIDLKTLPKTLLNMNQVRTLAASPSIEIKHLVESIWGAIRMQDSDQRKTVIAEIAAQLSRTSGDPMAGRIVFDRVCGQCHILHGKGQEVGPNITQNGRGNFEQLLSNVLDPSLVIGEAFQAVSVLTLDGVLVTGLVIEETDESISLKVQGGEVKKILKDDIENQRRSPNSLMPEGLEQQLNPREIADLFALLTLEQSPEQIPNAIIPGTPEALHRR